MKNLKTWLSAPSWQGIGAIITIIIGVATILWPAFLTSDNGVQVTEPKQSKLIVHQISEKDLLDLPGGLGQVSILINGKKENLVKSHEFQIGYQGDRHISPDEFVEPLRIEVKGNRKIISIIGFSDRARANFNNNHRQPDVGTLKGTINRPLSVDTNGMEYLLPIFDRMVDSKWKPISANSGELESLLLNPGDGMQIIVYTSIISPSKDQDNTELRSNQWATDFNWTCRIADVECPARPEIVAFPQVTEPNPFLAVWIFYQGLEVYYLTFSIVSLFAITLLLGAKWGVLKAMRLLHFWLIIVSMILSFSTGEILTDWFFRGRNIVNQPIIAKLLLSAYFILIICLVLPKLVANSRKSPQTKKIRNDQSEYHSL